MLREVRIEKKLVAHTQGISRHSNFRKVTEVDKLGIDFHLPNTTHYLKSSRTSVL